MTFLQLDSHILITAGDVFYTIGAMVCGIMVLAGIIGFAILLHLARKGMRNGSNHI